MKETCTRRQRYAKRWRLASGRVPKDEGRSRRVRKEREKVEETLKSQKWKTPILEGVKGFYLTLQTTKWVGYSINQELNLFIYTIFVLFLFTNPLYLSLPYNQ